MRQRLDARDRFYAEFHAVLHHFPDFAAGQTTAQIAEIRFVFHLVSILGIELQFGVPVDGQEPYQFFQRFRFQHGVSRQIRHKTQSVRSNL